MNKKVVIIIAIMTMTAFINNFAHPVTPELVESIGYGSLLLGVLFAAMSFSNFLLAPFWGKFSDKYGRKIFMVIAPIGYGLSQIGFGYSTDPYIIIGFRLIAGGFSCASFVAGMAYLIDVSDPGKRTKIIAFYTAITGFVATLGYLFGGLIGDKDYHFTFIAQGILSILSSIIILYFLKEAFVKTQVASSNILKDLLKYRKTVVPFLLVITMLTSFISIGFNNNFNSYMKFVLDLGPKSLGIIMAITGLIGLIMNIIIFPFIKRKFNDYYTLMISIFFIFTSLAVAMYFEENHFNVTIMVLIIFFAFLALYRPILQSILSKVGNANGEIMGLNSAFKALGNVGGSFYAGLVFAINVNVSIYSLSLVGILVFGLLLTKRKSFIELG